MTLNDSIDLCVARIGVLMVECGRARRLMINPLPITERQHILLGVSDAVHDLEESLVDVIAAIKKELDNG